jgi:8-oxo-dGTP pyrophosphatase MutT (NUDIX family)
MPDGSFAVFKDAGGKKRLATFLSKHMSPPGRDVTSLVKERLSITKSASIPEDAVVYSAVPDIDSVLRHGLMSSEALAKNQDLLAIARPDLEDRQAWLDKLNKQSRRLSRKGPNVFFTLPDPAKIHDKHYIKKNDLKVLEIALGKLIKDQPNTRIYGMELAPFPKEKVDKFPKRKGIISHKKVKELLGSTPEELWHHYNDPEGKTYAANVPHAAILTENGLIDPKYLKALDKNAGAITQPIKETLTMKKSANHMVEPSPDGGNYMAVSNLKSLKRNAEDLMCHVDAFTPLPDWVESKLNVAAASIDDVADWFRNGGELNKTADFADESLAQKAHDKVVKEYGMTPQDGSEYWRMKTRIYKSMGGTFTGKRGKKASEAYRPRVELFIHDGKGNVLANKSDKGWQFPGGGVEDGQDLFEAAKREALEEAGYNIKNLKKLSPEASKIPWPEWYKEVARKKGRGQFEGQLTNPIVAQIGKKNEKLYGSEGDALTKLKFVPLKKLIRDGEKRVSPDHDDIVDNNGEVIPGFGVFTKDTLKHLKNLDQQLSGKKTASLSLMSVAKDLRKTAGVYELMLKHSEEGLKPPAAVASAARRGLELRRKASPSNKGGLTASEASKQGIGSGVQRASNLANGDSVSPSTVKRMHSFFSRHEGNSAIGPENKGKPQNDKGYVSHLLWGGDAGKRWAASQAKKLSEKEAAFFNPMQYLSSFLNSPSKVVTRRQFMQDTALNMGVNALGEQLASSGARAAQGGSLFGAAGAVAGTTSPAAISRRGFLGQLGLRGALANSAVPTRVPGKASNTFGSSRVLDAANSVSGVRPLDGIAKGGPGALAEHAILSNPFSSAEALTKFLM